MSANLQNALFPDAKLPRIRKPKRPPKPNELYPGVMAVGSTVVINEIAFSTPEQLAMTGRATILGESTSLDGGIVVTVRWSKNASKDEKTRGVILKFHCDKKQANGWWSNGKSMADVEAELKPEKKRKGKSNGSDTDSGTGSESTLP